MCSSNNEFIPRKLHTGVYEARFAYLNFMHGRESHLNKPY